MSLPRSEKVDADNEDTDFLSNARAAGGADASTMPELNCTNVDLKHSSHCAYTRDVTVCRSSTADKMVNCSETDRMGVGSD